LAVGQLGRLAAGQIGINEAKEYVNEKSGRLLTPDQT
jgi:hypothetical protein